MASQAKIVKVRGSQITIEHDDGTPETSHQIYTGATVTLNGRPAALTDLKRHDLVSMLGAPVMVIAAFRPDAPSASNPPPAPPGALLVESSDEELLAELQRRGFRTPQPTKPNQERPAASEPGKPPDEKPAEGAARDAGEAHNPNLNDVEVPTQSNVPADDAVPATEGQRTVPADEPGGTTADEEGRESEKQFTAGQKVRFLSNDQYHEGTIEEAKPGNKTVSIKTPDRTKPHRVTREDVEAI